MSEIVEEIVGELNNIITAILRDQDIFQVKDVKTISNASVFKQDGEQDGDNENTTVVNNTNSQDTIINVAPNEIIETQETYTVGEDGKIEIQGEPLKKNYSL